MRSWLRLAWTLSFVVLHIVVALAIVGLLFPLSSASVRRGFVRWWSGRVLTIFGLELRLIGPPPEPAFARDVIARALLPDGRSGAERGGAMLVLNHVSWLDIFVVHSLRPARFVAKAEISRWPLLGFLTDRTGAVFIERGKRHAVREVNQRVAEMLGAGDLVGMFPEGAVSDGEHLLPFHGNLIQPAIDAGAPVIVGALRYRDRAGRPTTATYYVGDVTLLESIVRIARHGPLIVELHLLGVLEVASLTRHEVARAARLRIGEALGFDGERLEAVEELSTVIVVPDDALNRDAVLAGTGPGTAFDPRDELL